MKTIIDHPTHGEIVVRVLKHGLELAVEAPSYSFRSFWDDFAKMGEEVKAGRRTPSGEDLRHCKTLLAKHGQERLLIYARHFWRRHATECVADPTRPLMRSFTVAIPVIQGYL